MLNEKKRTEATKTLRAGCSKAEQKFSHHRRPPSRGRGTAKIQSSGDGHYRPINKHTNRQWRLQYTTRQLR